ncbi:MAG: 50S ribosomal protein L9 [Enterobacteriaceae bacterium]
MKIILLDKVLKLGYVGSKVYVKLGYARNFLIPKGISIFNNNKNNLKILIKNKLNNNINIKKEIETDKTLFINFYIKCNNKGNLYGSINYKKIIRIMNYNNIKIKKYDISNFKPIRKIGVYIIKIKIFNNYYKTLLLKVFNKI